MSPPPPGHQTAPAVHRVADVLLRGPAGSLHARAYWPAESEQLVASPLLVLFPADGSAPDGLDGAEALCRSLCAYVGVVVLSVTYRSATQEPDGAALEDAVAALHWAADHAAQLGADAGRLLVAGTGVGGHVAAAVAQRAKDEGWPEIGRVVSIHPDLAGAAVDDMGQGAAGRLLRSLARSMRPPLEA